MRKRTLHAIDKKINQNSYYRFIIDYSIEVLQKIRSTI